MPTITFKVNLETVNRYSTSLPNAPTDNIDNLRTTRSTWFPDLLRDNRALKHGDQFTVSGMQAIYLKNNFTSGDSAFLQIVSTT
jgi:hypothetical protein